MKLPLVLTALVASLLSLPALAQDVIRIRLAQGVQRIRFIRRRRISWFLANWPRGR